MPSGGDRVGEIEGLFFVAVRVRIAALGAERNVASLLAGLVEVQPHLVFEREREERAHLSADLGEELGRYAMPGEVEEALTLAGLSEGLGAGRFAQVDNTEARGHD